MSNFQKTVGPVPVGSVNVGAAAAAGAIAPLLSGLNGALTNPFGIGAMKADFVGQFKAQVNFSIKYGDPIAALKATIQASLSIVASLQASLVLGVPTANVQISTALSLAAALQAKIAGVNSLMDSILGVRLGGVNFLSQLNAAIGAGPVVGYGWSSVTMAQLQSQISGHSFVSEGFLPTDVVSGVMLVTKDPSAFVGMQFLFVTV